MGLEQNMGPGKAWIKVTLESEHSWKQHWSGSGKMVRSQDTGPRTTTLHGLETVQPLKQLASPLTEDMRLALPMAEETH